MIQDFQENIQHEKEILQTRAMSMRRNSLINLRVPPVQNDQHVITQRNVSITKTNRRTFGYLKTLNVTFV